MQLKLFFFLMFLFGVSGITSSLHMRRTGASSIEASSLSNAATSTDIVSERPNEAFLPDQSEIISYDVSFVDDVDDIYATEDLENTEEIEELANVDDVVPFEIPEVEDIDETIEEETFYQNEIATLRETDMVQNPSKRSLVKLNEKQSSIVDDKFSNIKVEEGEEVLVSTSEPVNTTIENVIPEVKQDLKEELNLASVEKTEKKSEPKQNIEKEKNIASTSEISDESPFGVIVSKPNKKAKKSEVKLGSENPFVRAFSALKPEKVKDYNKFMKSKEKEKTISFVSSDVLKKDLQNTYLSDNKFLSPVESLDEEYFEDEVEEEFEEESEEYAEEYADDENFDSQEDVKDALEGKGPVDINSIKSKIQTTKKSSEAPSGPLKAGVREVLQMKIDFQEGSSAVSGESVNLIRSFAQIATEQPTNSIEITIPQSVRNNPKKKKLIARRLSIVSNVLRNAGISDRQIKPVLSDREEDSFVFRVVSNDKYGTLRISKGVDMFGEEENVKEYNIMKW